MHATRVFGIAYAFVVIGACAASVRAAECEATEACWRRCRPAASCYACPPCDAAACCCEPAPRRCGPIRRLLGLCCPKPVAACQTASAAVVSGCAPPCSSGAEPAMPTLAPGLAPSSPAPAYPAPAVLPPVPTAPTGSWLRSTDPQQVPVAAGRQSTYEAPPMPPLSVPSLRTIEPAIPVRLDHLASFTKSQ